MQMTGLKKDTIYLLSRQGTFPRPIKLSVQASGWVKAEVEEWISQRIVERDARSGRS
jgi:prophage regulatory protein